MFCSSIESDRSFVENSLQFLIHALIDNCFSVVLPFLCVFQTQPQHLKKDANFFKKIDAEVYLRIMLIGELKTLFGLSKKRTKI